MTLVELKDARSKTTVIVNPLQVRYLRREEGGAVIIFDSQTTVTVEDPIENVARMLAAAMSS